ncbi:hypothetical protein V6N13_028351 [Hibiscus sabdariffa]
MEADIVPVADDLRIDSLVTGNMEAVGADVNKKDNVESQVSMGGSQAKGNLSYAQVTASRSNKEGWVADEQRGSIGIGAQASGSRFSVLQEEHLERGPEVKVVKGMGVPSNDQQDGCLTQNEVGRSSVTRVAVGGEGTMKDNRVDFVALDHELVSAPVGKSGKENVSNGLSIRTKSGSSLPRKMALSEWVNSVSNQLDELVARSGDKEVTSVRSMEEDDLGDYRDVEVEVVLEDQVDGKGDGVVTEDGMML